MPVCQVNLINIKNTLRKGKFYLIELFVKVKKKQSKKLFQQIENHCNDCCKKLLCVNNFEKQSLQKLEEISNSEQHQHYLLCCQRCLLFWERWQKL